MKNLIKTYLFSNACLLILFNSQAQTSSDYGRSVKQCKDNGYIIAGSTRNFGVGPEDVYLVKTDSSGNLQWSKTYGGLGAAGTSVLQTRDEGFIITGGYGLDVFLLKTDKTGNLSWSKRLGWALPEAGKDIQQCNDGGFIIAGNTRSFETRFGDLDAFLMKTDSLGNIQWAKIYGGDNQDLVFSVAQCSDGGFLMTGVTFTGYKFTPIEGPTDPVILLIKTDENGNLQFMKTYVEYYQGHGYSVQQTTDGGFIITGFGYTISTQRAFFIKTDSLLNVEWTKRYNNSVSRCYSVQQCSDEGYIATGTTSNSSNSNWEEVYLIRTDKFGSLLWSKTYGGAGIDIGYSVQQANDGGFIITGQSNVSILEDYHLFLLKTDSLGDLKWFKYFGGNLAFKKSSLIKQQNNENIYDKFPLWEDFEKTQIENKNSYVRQTSNTKDANCSTDVTSSLVVSIPSTIAGIPQDSFNFPAINTTTGGTIVSIPIFTDSIYCTVSVGISDIDNVNSPFISYNYPNPFSSSTTIQYYVPETINHAEIVIYDLITGSIKKSIPIKNRGNGHVEYYNNELPNGLYIYCLKLDGVLVSTKQMVIIK